MHDDLRALIDKLVGDEDFREAFLAAPDRAARIELAEGAGLNVPSESHQETAQDALDMDEGDAYPGSEFAGGFYQWL